MDKSIQIFNFLFSRNDLILLFLLRLRYPTYIYWIFFTNFMNLRNLIVIRIILLMTRINSVLSDQLLLYWNYLLSLFLLFNFLIWYLCLRHKLSLLSLVNSWENLISQFQTNFYLLMFILSEFHNILWSSSMFQNIHYSYHSVLSPFYLLWHDIFCSLRNRHFASLLKRIATSFFVSFHITFYFKNFKSRFVTCHQDKTV